MSENQTLKIRVLGSADVALSREMLHMFGAAFEDLNAYSEHQPDDAYLLRFLANRDCIAMVALLDGKVVGGLIGYVLAKMGQVRSEVYLYDLAVDEGYRRRGIATALIRELHKEGMLRGAQSVFVQADPVDDAAIALYTKLGMKVAVFHFDLLDEKNG